MVRLVMLLAACQFFFASFFAEIRADESAAFREALKELAEYSPVSTSIGVTRKGVAIPAFLTNGMLDVRSDRTRILIVSNSAPASAVTKRLVSDWSEFCSRRSPAANKSKIELGIVPFANPDSFGTASDSATSIKDASHWKSGFPPTGSAYNDQQNSERHYLWRWIGMLAPDLVIVVGENDFHAIEIPKSFKNQLGISANWSIREAKAGSLADALTGGKPSEVAGVPAVEFLTSGRVPILPGFVQPGNSVRSAARLELQRRRNRSPIEVAQELAQVYGHNLNSVAYIPALALIGRVRLSELTSDESHLKDVLKIVEPYASGQKPALDQKSSGSTLSGHLIFGELATKTGDTRFVKLAQAAADLGFDDNGELRQSMPFHNEMSDAVFMGTPILVQTGRLTGDTKYFDMADRHAKFMLKLNLREDGLHQHSPLDPEHTAWGRGNGFPALGLALSLSDMPVASPHFQPMLKAYREHLLAMIDHQDEMGMWHQIVDRPESYREFTVTCMTTFAMVRGLRNGWLKRETFEPFVQRAWESIKCRIGPDGKLVDVCTGTGKQKSRREYFDRPAILGRDDRGGAMALMVSTELAFAKREGAIQLQTAESASR
ncbi:MAG: glycoside hydrolase family 88 protein [Rhodopirellula sp.]|nr:glycoside hydrolase family 88 protein [Rhodopirellula sp.]